MNTIEIDSLKNWVTMIKQLKADRAEIDEQIDIGENQIKELMGDAEIGTVDGEPVVRWTHVVSNRFDQTAAKALLSDDQIADCIKPSESRRFTIVEV